MKIRFLGTSHGMEEPASDRYRQSILIEAGERSFVFDAGAPVYDILKKESYDFSRIKAVFISHAHGDHTQYLPELLGCEELKDTKFYLPDIDMMLEYASDFKRDCFKICEGVFYNDLFVRVRSVKTRHLVNCEGESISFGFMLEHEGKRVHITGDMTAEMTDFPAYIHETHVDMLISECAHFSVDRLFEELELCNIDTAAVIHVHHPDKYTELKERLGKNSFELILPDDGDIYNI